MDSSLHTISCNIVGAIVGTFVGAKVKQFLSISPRIIGVLNVTVTVYTSPFIKPSVLVTVTLSVFVVGGINSLPFESVIIMDATSNGLPSGCLILYSIPTYGFEFVNVNVISEIGVSSLITNSSSQTISCVIVGDFVGILVGDIDGALVGVVVGDLVGDTLGSFTGDVVGAIVGFVVGAKVKQLLSISIFVPGAS